MSVQGPFFLQEAVFLGNFNYELIVVVVDAWIFYDGYKQETFFAVFHFYLVLGQDADLVVMVVWIFGYDWFLGRSGVDLFLCVVIFGLNYFSVEFMNTVLSLD